jgi:hypothetical protein
MVTRTRYMYIAYLAALKVKYGLSYPKQVLPARYRGLLDIPTVVQFIEKYFKAENVHYRFHKSPPLHPITN